MVAVHSGPPYSPGGYAKSSIGTTTGSPGYGLREGLPVLADCVGAYPLRALDHYLDPHNFLKDVHQDLASVVSRAYLLDMIDFQITYGLRTKEAEWAAVASGHSQTMHSRHLATKTQPKACAVDLTPRVHEKLTFFPGHEAAGYGPLWVAMHTAAESLGIPIEWGGDWQTLKDWGHFQLPWKDYP